MNNEEALKKLKSKKYEKMNIEELEWAKAYKDLAKEEEDENKIVPSKLDTFSAEHKYTGDNLQTAYQNWTKHNETLLSRSGYDNNLKDTLKNVKFQVRENQMWKEAGFNKLFSNTDSDTGCEDIVASWSPADVYSKAIWGAAVCKADLFQICVKGISINPGQGLKAQIRTYGSFGDPTSLGSCECASCASISFSTYTLTLKQYNLEAIVCEKDVWDVGTALSDSYIKAMSDSWARWFDEQIYYELRTASAGNVETLGTALSCSPSIGGSCCTDTSLIEMYNAVNKLIADIREASYNPDYIIISPTVAAIFKRMQTPNSPFALQDVKFDEDGRVKRISGLKAIEYCGATSCTNASGSVVAIIVDSSRAVGAVFGQRPKLYKFFQSNCNSVRLDMWSFFACGELDLAAIGQIKNP